MSIKQDDTSVTISLPSGASATVYFFGAHVTSWKAGGKERLYLSRKSALDGSAPIRGGIPIGWPNAGPSPTASEVAEDPSLVPHSEFSSPGHAFVRTLQWDLSEKIIDNDSTISLKFTLPSSRFPARFPQIAQVGYTVTLTDTSLRSDLHVLNPGDAAEALKFKMILHTYLSVGDSAQTRLEGIPKGETFVDNMAGGAERTWEGGDLTMDKETGMVLRSNVSNLTVRDTDDAVHVSWPDIPEVQLWNPQDRAGTLSWSDMEVGDGKRFVCVEPGILSFWKSLAPGESYVGSQILSV